MFIDDDVVVSIWVQPTGYAYNTVGKKYPEFVHKSHSNSNKYFDVKFYKNDLHSSF